MRSKADIGPAAPTNLDLGVFDRTTSPFIPCRISLSITPNAGSAVTKWGIEWDLLHEQGVAVI